MSIILLRIVITTFFLVVFAANSFANFKDGHKAYLMKDYKKAFKLWKEVAQKGNTEAQLNIGFLYYYGLGVKQSYKNAKYWFEKAGNNGNPEAQSQLGVLYLHGQGEDQSIKKALSWFKKAAEKNDAGALFNIASMYANGMGVKQDFEIAIKYAQKSARLDNHGGQILTAQLLQNSTIKKDLFVALKWCYVIQFKKDFPGPEFQKMALIAEEMINNLSAKLDKEDVNLAKEKAQMFFQKNYHNKN